MKKVSLALLLLASGCAGIVTKKARLDHAPRGVRIYPPKVYLMVDNSQFKSTITFLPDYTRAYDIQPATLFAKQDFKVEVVDGQLKSIAAGQDTTAFIALLRQGADYAAQAAGIGTASTTVAGCFDLPSGIYVMDDNGVFRRTTVE